MKKETTIEVNLGVGLNMIFPSPTNIILSSDENIEIEYENYLKFVKTLKEPDYNYLVEDINNNTLREMTFDEFVLTHYQDNNSNID
jgi:hypothetical protein